MLQAAVGGLWSAKGRCDMKANRFWIAIVTLGTAIACGLALLIATLAAGAVSVAGETQIGQETESTSAEQQAYEGMVTCSRCGAKHSAALGRTAADCVRVCAHSGSTFALVDGDKSYTLEGDLVLLKKLAGQRARILGVVRGNTITVASSAPPS